MQRRVSNAKRDRFGRFLNRAKNERGILIEQATELGVSDAEQLENKDLTQKIALARIRNS